MNDALGYAASLAVLATFLMRSMVSLRLVAILSNILFVTYGYFAHIHPVLLLHLLLFPINLARLSSCRSDYSKLLHENSGLGLALMALQRFLRLRSGLASVSPTVYAIVRRTHAILWDRGSV
jgi:hypothetical protein